MAQLKDLIVSGASRFIGKLFAKDVEIDKLKVNTSPVQIGSNGSEGGEIHLQASVDTPAQAGIILDHNNSSFRIFGIPSADGSTKTGAGTPLVVDPYAKTITGGYTFDGSAASLSATLPVPKGGTGATTFTSGAALIGNGTGAVTTRAITDSSASGSVTGSNLATCNTINHHVNARLNRTNGVNAANTAYTTYMARAIAADTISMTAKSSALTNGCIYLQYE